MAETGGGSMSVAHDWRLGPYTVDDLDDPARFPPDEGTYEMRDGWILMSPWRGLSHEIIIDNPDRAAEDHIAKVADYARAGIEWHWLIDTDPALSVTVLRLVGATYVEHATASGTETLILGEPYPIRIDVDSLRAQ
jgi:Putative restriction endonuclease